MTGTYGEIGSHGKEVAVTVIEQEVDPGDVGLDRGRLGRIDDHFRRYVDDGLLPGYLVAISRRGRIAHLSTYGQRDLESGAPLGRDTLFRIYSMTKPVVAVAIMALYEEGRIGLKDPLEQFIPSFANPQVLIGGDAADPKTEPASDSIRIWNLLTHTAGLGYGTADAGPVDELYRNAGLVTDGRVLPVLAEACDRMGPLPLLFHPGEQWCYSFAADVLGRVVEVVSGVPFDEFLRRRIFEPLGMTDTDFGATAGNIDRLAALYQPDPATERAVRFDARGNVARSKPAYLGGGGGLVSTAHDYRQFAEMLRNGGEWGGERVLGPKTIEYMARNHLPGGVDIEECSLRPIANHVYAGLGFGLGLSTVIDPARQRVACNPGEFAWGGAASTAFWVDPTEDVVALFFTQVMSATRTYRNELKQLAYPAIID